MTRGYEAFLSRLCAGASQRRPRCYLAIFALCAALAAGVSAADAKEKKAMEWKGAFCPVTEPTQIVASTPPEWTALWVKLGKPAPQADLKKFFAVGVFLGMQPTGGYGIAWKSAGNTVHYKVKKPEGMAIQALTQPYVVKLFPKAPGEIKVIAEGD
jgi:hypothetical protein